ncbi:hypothetical protein Ddc_16494 [Ditylenchus destructor]|nr:hypothetical protein Ddc_16494 [Ditylenchus destructor]
MSSLPNEIFYNVTSFLPNDDIIDLMLLSKKFNSLVTPRMKKIDKEMTTMNQNIESFMPVPAPADNHEWIPQLNLKRFEPIGSKGKKRMKELFATWQDFDDCFCEIETKWEVNFEALDRLKNGMSLERFDDATFLRILFTLVAIPKFRDEYNIPFHFATKFRLWFMMLTFGMEFNNSYVKNIPLTYIEDVSHIWIFYRWDELCRNNND